MSQRLSRWSACVLLALAVPARAGGSPAGQSPRPLEAGGTHEYRLAGGEEHLHPLELEPGAWLLSVEQDGLDVVLELEEPGGERLGALDDPLDALGVETLLIEAPAAGSWRLRVRPREPTAAAGSYRIRLERLADATEGDRLRIAAERVTTAAHRASAEGTPEAFRRALGRYAAALDAWKRLGERRREAQALNCLALVHHRLDERQRSLELFERALVLWRQLGDEAFEATTLNDAGIVHQELGDADVARELYVRARRLFGDLDMAVDQAIAHNNLCVLDHRRGELAAARDCYLESLPAVRRAGMRDPLAGLLNNLGGVHYQLGEPEEARRYFVEALELRRRAGDLDGEAQVLNNLASLERYLGAWQVALALYDRALELRRLDEDRWGEAKVLNNVGYAYLNLGESDRALGFFERAQRLRQELGDRAGQAVTLTNLGTVYHLDGNPAKALAFRRRALELRQELGKTRDVARTHLWIARDLRAMGDVAAARAELEQSIELFAGTDDQRYLGRARSDLGRLLLELGLPEEARVELREALSLTRQVRDAAGEAETLVALAETEQQLGRLESAGTNARTAVERLESLRAGIGIPELQASFLAARRRAYELEVEIAMERHRRRPAEGHERAALEASERAHARALLDLLAESRIDPTEDLDPALAERRRQLDERLRFLGARRLRLTEPESAGELDRELQALAAELDRLEAESRRSDPRYAELVRPSLLDVAAIQALLDAETALIEIALGERASFLWWVTADGVDSFVLPPRAEIEELAVAAHRELATVEAGVAAARTTRGPVEDLGRILLDPLGDRLSSQRLAVVADGALHLVPFAGLPRPGADGEPGAPLLVRHEVVQLPSASVLAFLRRPPRRAPRLAAAVLADPLLGPDFDRLPASGREAAAIRGLLPPGDVVLALGADANRRTVMGDAFAAARVVHFATHGVIDAERPRLSGLALSPVAGDGDAFFGLSDVYSLDLAAEIVVLSGCRTALGKAMWGEGLVGLVRGFMHAGAPRVIASLWRVEDRATSELMAQFYRALWTDGATPAAALRSAQLALLSRGRFRDPYYWAGFVLQGDWR